ncbi:MAG: DnaJ domain-containing protein [Candidatus Magasanikbacteria bacterium]
MNTEWGGGREGVSEQEQQKEIDSVREQIERVVGEIKYWYDHQGHPNMDLRPNPLGKIKDVEREIESLDYFYVSQDVKQELYQELMEQASCVFDEMVDYVEWYFFKNMPEYNEDSDKDFAELVEDCESYLDQLENYAEEFDLVFATSRVDDLQEDFELYREKPNAYKIELIKDELHQIKEEDFSEKLFSWGKNGLELDHKFISADSVRSKLENARERLGNIEETLDIEYDEDVDREELSDKDRLNEKAEWRLETAENFVEQLEDALKVLELYYEFQTLANKFDRGGENKDRVLDKYNEIMNIINSYYNSESVNMAGLSNTLRAGEGMRKIKKLANIILKDLGLSSKSSYKQESVDRKYSTDVSKYLQQLGFFKQELANLNSEEIIEKLKKRKRELSLKFHPDLNNETGNEEKMKEINRAYDKLAEYYSE